MADDSIERNADTRSASEAPSPAGTQPPVWQSAGDVPPVPRPLHQPEQPLGAPQAKGRLLRRSRQDRMIAGVAGGLGCYAKVDPTVVRLALVLLTVFGGSGVLIYLLAWILIPEAKPGELLD